MPELSDICHHRYPENINVRVEALIAKVEAFKKRHPQLNLNPESRRAPENREAMAEAQALCVEVKLAIYKLYDEGPHIDAHRLLAAHEDMNRICEVSGKNPEDYFSTHTEVESQKLETPIKINGAVIRVVTAVVSVLEVRTEPLEEGQTVQDIQRRRGAPVTMTYTIRADFDKDQGRITWPWQEDLTPKQMEQWITNSDTFRQKSENTKVRNQLFAHAARGNMNAAIAAKAAEECLTEHELWNTSSHITLVNDIVGANKIEPSRAPYPKVPVLKNAAGRNIFEDRVFLARPSDILWAIDAHRVEFGAKIDQIITAGKFGAVRDLIIPAMRNTLGN